jgi:hypothetical protein
MDSVLTPLLIKAVNAGTNRKKTDLVKKIANKMSQPAENPINWKDIKFINRLLQLKDYFITRNFAIGFLTMHDSLVPL